MTKLFALGVLGAGAVAAVRAFRNAKSRQQQQIDAFDYGDLDEPVIITEEVVVVTEAGPYEIDMELVPNEDVGKTEDANVDQSQVAQPNQGESTFEMPGRGSAPR